MLVQGGHRKSCFKYVSCDMKIFEKKRQIVKDQVRIDTAIFILTYNLSNSRETSKPSYCHGLKMQSGEIHSSSYTCQRLCQRKSITNHHNRNTVQIINQHDMYVVVAKIPNTNVKINCSKFVTRYEQTSTHDALHQTRPEEESTMNYKYGSTQK